MRTGDETTGDEVFESLRGHAFRVAYQMIGSAADAEDLVQEAWIRWRHVDSESIVSPRAWITTVVTRLAMNYLASARVRRERYVGAWLPEPIPTPARGHGEDAAELEETLSVAFMFLLESLSPKERAAFLLHEAFGMPHQEVAEVLGTSPEASRKLLHRARLQLRARRPRFRATERSHRELLDRFRAAAEAGELDALSELLAADVVVHSDGGGKARAALRPVHGRANAARFISGAVAKFVPDHAEGRVVSVNGGPALVSHVGGAVLAVIAADVADGVIQSLFIVTNPEKLHAVQVALEA